jgi:hypothetical protein
MRYSGDMTDNDLPEPDPSAPAGAEDSSAGPDAAELAPQPDPGANAPSVVEDDVAGSIDRDDVDADPASAPDPASQRAAYVEALIRARVPEIDPAEFVPAAVFNAVERALDLFVARIDQLEEQMLFGDLRGLPYRGHDDRVH